MNNLDLNFSLMKSFTNAKMIIQIMDVTIEPTFAEVMFLKISKYVITSFPGPETEGIRTPRLFGTWLDIIWIAAVVVNDPTNGVDIYVAINPSLSNPKLRSRIPTISDDPAATAAFISTKSSSLICPTLALELLLPSSNMDGDNWLCIIFAVNNEMTALVPKETNGQVPKIT